MSPIPAGAGGKRHTIGNVALYYERAASGDPWGDLSKGERTGIFLTPFTYEKLSSSFDALWAYTGRPIAIITAGGWVEKPGAHGLARAFDLDGIIWGPDSWWKASSYMTDVNSRAFYCGLMCHFSMTFGNVLGAEYNRAHFDHIHLDDLVEPVFRLNSMAVITTIQASLRYIWKKANVEIDGVWGLHTAKAFSDVVNYKPSRYPNQADYEDFLNQSRKKALPARLKEPRVTNEDLALEITKAAENEIGTVTEYRQQDLSDFRAKVLDILNNRVPNLKST